MQHRLYVITSNELAPVYACVQGAHAVAQYLLDSPDSEWKNDYLIFLKGDLEKVQAKLEYNNVSYTKFHEPDLNNKLTAVAVLNNQNLFKNLQTV